VSLWTDIDRRRMACGCAIKIDLRRVVYPALRILRSQLEPMGVRLAGREDADIFPRTEGVSFERHIYPFEKQDIDPLPRGASYRAVTVSSVYRLHDPKGLSDRWLQIYRALLQRGANLYVGKGHTIEAYSPRDEFFHLDLYAPQGLPKAGWRVANNDTNQLIDPTRELDAPEQTEVALSNALNDLFALGAVEDVQVYPFYAAPSTTLAQRIVQHMDNFCERYGFEHVPQEPVSEETFLLGATVFATSSRQLPTFYHKLREGDMILLHRSLGDLAPINVLIAREVLGDGGLHNLSLSHRDIEQAVERRIKIMRRPNLDVARVIQRFCPEFAEPFDPMRHLKATGDLSGPGIDVFRELAELTGRDVILEKIPLADETLVRWASANFLIPDGTAGTNGALTMIGTPQVVELLAAELEKLGHQPHLIGHVGGPGGRLIVPAEVRDYISDWPDAYSIQEER